MSVTHATFVIERTYDASPARVFAAFASQSAKGSWFVGPDEWQGAGYEQDFRIGGKERVSGGPEGGPTHHFEATYQDIVPDERIITSYEMHLDEAKISVSLSTVEFQPSGDGTKLVYTEQGAFLDGFDDPKLRETGTVDLLDNLGTYLAKQTVTS
jgi:uncharacterized protein YndB with AHSA1/START domain